MHPPPPFCWEGRGGVVVALPTKFSKRGGLTGPQLLEGVAGKEGVTFFRGVAIFTQQKIKSEIFNDKKSF